MKILKKKIIKINKKINIFCFIEFILITKIFKKLLNKKFFQFKFN